MHTPRLLVACATRRTSHVLALCMGAIIGHTQAQAAQSTPAASESLEEVIVTGFRQSLKSSTEAKRESVGFVDSIFAEDIGKFPDTNIAESFQRIPGVQISREISGEGNLVAIRGLNTNFTQGAAEQCAGRDRILHAGGLERQSRSAARHVSVRAVLAAERCEDGVRGHARRRRRRHDQHAHGAAVRSRRRASHLSGAGHRQQQGRRHRRAAARSSPAIPGEISAR